MTRYERFRELRVFKIKLSIFCIGFVIVLFTGIGVVDYSVSSLLGKQGMEAVSITRYNKDYYRLNFFDESMYINVKYIMNDYKRFVEWINRKSDK